MADLNLATGVTVTVRPPDTPTILSGPPQTTATVTPPVFNVTIGAPLTPGLVAGVGTSATVMPGTAGPAGADGAPGPQGEPGPAGADGEGGGSSGGRLLSGTAAPLSGSGLEPLDGINDPWRWSAMLGGWVGPVYETTWLAGDEVPELLTVPTGANRVDLLIGSFTTLAESLTTTPPFSTGGTPTLSEGISDNGFGGTATTGPLIADADGAGITFLLQTEIGFTHTTVPDPTLDITTMLGDVTAGAPYTFAETGDGADGDYWRDTTTGDMYGPKTTGTWAGVIGKLFDPATYQVVSEPWFFFTDDGEAPINFSGGPTEPADIDINTGCIALWYDNTAAAPAVNFKAKDADGTIYVATLPMTPA